MEEDLLQSPNSASASAKIQPFVMVDIPGLGRLYEPPGDRYVPHVLVLHGSEGAWSGFAHLQAASFAARGIAALPLGYSMGGNLWNAGAIENVPIDKTAEALDALRRLPRSTGKVGVYGVSRGAEHALLLAVLMTVDDSMHEPDAVAVHAPPDVICGAFDAKEWRDPGDPGWRAWDPSRRAWTWKGASDTLLPSQPIEIQQYAGPLLISAGENDTTWSSAMAKRLGNRYATDGRAAEQLIFPGEGHVLSAEATMVRDARISAFFAEHLVPQRTPL